MAFAHSLEVLYALLRLYASGTASSSSFSDVPYPHLQQRLQQTLRAVALTAFCTVLIPLLLLCLLPLLSPLEFPGFTSFLLVIASLWTATVAHLTLRYALLPTPRRAEAEPVRGGLQAAVCAIMDAVTRVREQPQLPVLLLLCVAHSYVWKLVLYYGMASSAYVAVDFGSFAVAGGLVAFVSFVLVEKSLAEDPFVLDPRAAFVRAMQRDVVRAVRRGVLVYIVGRAWSWLFVGSSEVGLKATETAFFSLHSSRVMFQITTSFLENLAILSAASVFRILLFRASHQVVGGAFGETNNLWDSLASVKPKEGDVVTALFATEAAANPQNTTPLNEQYLQGLHKRMDAAVKKISDKKTPKAPADAEDVEILDSLFKFENLLTGCKFDAAARETLFTSWDRWNALFSSTTAVVDGFTLMLQVLNTLPGRKGDAGDCSPTGALALEQSVAALLRFLNSQHDAHPLLVLQQYPHLANLRISSSSVKSSIRFFVESKLQFAIRRFLMEEARRRVFQRAKVVRAAESLLCHLVSVSRAEDKQGYVQHTVPAVVSSLLECRNALDAYMETCLKESSTTDVYVQEATALAKGIDSGIYRITEVFQGELSLFAFPPGVKKALLAYASFDA
ncbi:hypothetical protein JG687_00001886 [Phytophthora cactorum]|uniref:Nucleoporin protein Ndc1-Nup n=1 Tax=Phytophthora cactorum TaxID=29920 RepID=A0A8T1UWH2_9STRA|nr:hypothetical protein PC120_g6482 [Phytophthora cactorum]KAG3103024.1 hypothetical protein PC121_g1075 [Phytophthora cactorum]KAG3205273.1 hypothetical protein PC128_g1472 [Phytophthora cactorum]KAG4058567.1 hypothetical protein PC123_g6455 [Phytophthora cactorum]KAG6971691.1 hypothetical protein JG687_00001886 [Phytophthora cactorum]